MSGITAASMAMYGAMAAAAYSAYSTAHTASVNAQNQANVADYNAKTGHNNALSALQAGNANEEAQRRRSAQELGRQRAGLAENGIGLDSGTASDLTEQSSMNAEMDALNIRYGAAQNAQAMESGAVLDLNQAKAARSSAQSLQNSAYVNAGTSALTTYGRYGKG